MSDGIANAAAAAAALIADAENTLQGKLRTAHDKADRLAERCSALEAQLSTEQNASAEAARLRRAAAALLALNERLLVRAARAEPFRAPVALCVCAATRGLRESSPVAPAQGRLAPGAGHSGSHDGGADASHLHGSLPHSPARLAFAAESLRDTALLEGLRAAVDVASMGPGGSAVGRAAQDRAAAGPPGVAAVAGAAAQRTPGTASGGLRPSDPLLVRKPQPALNGAHAPLD